MGSSQGSYCTVEKNTFFIFFPSSFARIFKIDTFLTCIRLSSRKSPWKREGRRAWKRRPPYQSVSKNSLATGGAEGLETATLLSNLLPLKTGLKISTARRLWLFGPFSV